MIILLDTSTPVCKLRLVEGDFSKSVEWQSDRNLAKDLLKFLSDNLSQIGKSWSDISGIGVYAGPGSFTGLRIGLTVANTIADAQAIPIVGGLGDDWQVEALEKLNKNENEKIVLPFYGREANITQARK